MTNNNKNPSGFDVYTSGRAVWDDRYGSLIAQTKTWRLLAFMSLALCAIASLGLISLSTTSSIVPFVVYLDKEHNLIEAYPADRLQNPSDAAIKSVLAGCVENWREVTADNKIQQQQIKKLYAHLVAGSQAINAINAWYRTNNPYERAAKETTQIKVTNVLRETQDSFRIQWEENRQDRLAQQPAEKYQYSALLGVTRQEVTAENILVNPLGIFIVNIDFSQEQKQ